VTSLEYYWAKADEALAKADTQKLLSGYFIAVALAYRTLAFGEVKFRSCWPGDRLHTGARRSSR
jgi:hypothetical protein